MVFSSTTVVCSADGPVCEAVRGAIGWLCAGLGEGAERFPPLPPEVRIRAVEETRAGLLAVAAMEEGVGYIRALPLFLAQEPAYQVRVMAHELLHLVARHAALDGCLQREFAWEGAHVATPGDLMSARIDLTPEIRTESLGQIARCFDPACHVAFRPPPSGADARDHARGAFFWAGGAIAFVAAAAALGCVIRYVARGALRALDPTRDTKTKTTVGKRNSTVVAV